MLKLFKLFHEHVILAVIYLGSILYIIESVVAVELFSQLFDSF